MRFLFAFATTTAMIATGGFGAFPDNPLTLTFQEVLSENIPADFLDPFNDYMEVISAPQIPPKPASSSGNDSPPDPLGFFEDLFASDGTTQSPPIDEAAVVETALASMAETQTQIVLSTPSLTAANTLTPTGTQTSTSTFTLAPTATESMTPTWTVPPALIYPTSTNTREPLPADTPTITPSPTDTLTPFLGFDVSSVDVNGAGAYAIVSPGATVNVSYAFNVYDDPCPGCITQLVTGLGTAGTHGGTCAFDGDAALFPGAPGSEDVILTAPTTPGIYSVVVEYHWQFNCADALTAYGSSESVPSQTIAQIEVQAAPIVLYEGGTSIGSIGPRASADAICAANLPSGYGNFHAFIGYSAADSIANMPSNYGIPTNVPVHSASSVAIGNDWADMMDGAITTTLTGAGVTSGFWWSGAEDASGSHMDGVTQDCNEWTSALNTDGGNYGDPNVTGSQWMDLGVEAACDQVLVVLCVGY